MAIYRVRTVDLTATKASTARDIMVTAAVYLTAHFPGVRVEILSNVEGPPHQLHMVTRCESLPALDAYEAQRADDAGWQALLNEYRALGADVGTVDRFYQVEA